MGRTRMRAPGPFRPVSPSASVPASTTSNYTPIPKGSAALRVFNNSSAIAFWRTGVDTQTADPLVDLPAAPNSVEVFTVPEAHDCFACVLPSGTGTVYVTRREVI